MNAKELREKASKLVTEDGTIQRQDLQDFAQLHIAASLDEAGERDKRKLEIMEEQLTAQKAALAIAEEYADIYEQMSNGLPSGFGTPGAGPIAVAMEAVDALDIPTRDQCECVSIHCHKDHGAGRCSFKKVARVMLSSGRGPFDVCVFCQERLLLAGATLSGAGVPSAADLDAHAAEQRLVTATSGAVTQADGVAQA